MTTANEEQTIASDVLYPSLVQLVIHAETISWNRFYNFLMANSILILAWATIYAPQQHPAFATTVLVVISVLGLVSCVAAAALGVRGREYLSKYVDLGVCIEADEKCWGMNLAQYKLLTITKQYGKEASFCWARSRYLLWLGPVAFFVLNGFLLCVSFRVA